MTNFESKTLKIVNRVRSEPPLLAAVITVVIYSSPAFLSIIKFGHLNLPDGFTRHIVVEPVFALIAIFINFFLLIIFITAPAIKVNFNFILINDWVRKLLIFFYWSLSLSSILMIEVKIKYVSLILSDPLLAIVSGGLIADEHLLLYFFLGISGLIGFALIRKEDGFFLNFIGGLFSVLIVVFYFFLGRREVAIMSICFLLLAKGKGISKVKWLLLGVSSLVIVVFIMSLRIGDEGKKIYDLNSEELSPVSYSSYIIQQNELYNPLRGITEATILRPFLFNKSSIAVQYFKNEVGDPAATPVIGIAGITYMYGFIVPFINVFILGVLFRTVSVSFNKSKSPWLKIFLIYLTFKAFNLFRNGEFSILSLDILMFTILMIPALMFKFEKRSAT